MKPGWAETLQDALKQMQAHATDQLGLLLGKGVERAVVQDDVAGLQPWLEAVVTQQAHQDARVPLAWLLAGPITGPFARHGLTEVTRPPVKNLAGRLTELLGLDNGPSQEAPGEVVMTRRQRDRDLASGALVVLGRAARTGAAASRAARERDCEQALFGQAVEMEGSRAPGDTERCCHVVSTDRGSVSTHVVVDAPPGGLIQTRHRRDVSASLTAGLTDDLTDGLTEGLTDGFAKGRGMHS